MKKNVKKSLRQYEALKLHAVQLKNLKGGNSDSSTSSDIVIEQIIDP
ncbi:MAG: hypothetical protein AAGG75_11135 [Bacteroidota bacterium]